MSEIVFIADNNRNILFLNKEGQSLFKLNGDYRRSGDDFLNLFHADCRDLIIQSLEEAKNCQLTETGSIEVRLLTSLHSKNLLKFKLTYSEARELDKYIGSIERKKNRKSKNKDLNLFPGFFENLPLGIYRTTIEGKVQFVNTGFLKIFGFDSEQELHKINILELFVEKSQRFDLIKKCIEDKNYSFEFQAKRRDKRIIWLKDSCRAVLDDDGKALFLDGIIEDITQQKLNEQLLLESEAKLKESNLSKDRFFSIISHDLRSPFNQIIGATELLISKIDEYDSQMIKKFLVLLNEEATQSFRLLENLLQWSKNQRGIIQFEPKPINLDKLVKDVLLVLETIVLQKDISVVVDFPDDLCVYADKEMLSTILRNLISNAIKFTGQEGEIVLIAHEKMDYSTSQSYVEFCVSDSGIGIDNKDLQKLFSLSENYNSKGTYNETGTGLGLLLCKEFVDQHNGNIWAESTPGEGSQFKFTIPY